MSSLIIVLGAGIVGSAVISDLSRSYETVAFDLSKDALEHTDASRKIRGNIFDHRSLIEKADIVVSSLPGSISYSVCSRLLRMGKNVLDTSFMEEDPFTLDPVAKRNGCCFVPDAGYAPGLTNIIAGRIFSQNNPSDMKIYVGGLPTERLEPLLHAVTFNVEGFVDEYVRPARLVRGGKVVSVDPFEDIREISVPGQHGLETFYTDGLRTMLRTLKIVNICEMTLRYRGHLERMRFLRDMGYLSGGRSNGSPRLLTEKLLSDMKIDFRDMCLTFIHSSGEENVEYSNIDHYDRKIGMSSMARMTGFTAASIARLILESGERRKGILPPEYFGLSENDYDDIIRYLGRHRIKFSVKSSSIH